MAKIGKMLAIILLLGLYLKCASALLNPLDFHRSEIFSSVKPSDSYDMSDKDLNCLVELQNIGNGFQSRDEWALKLLDSWGKIPPGMYSGNNFDFGSFDQCFEVERGGMPYETKYCLGSIGLGPEVHNQSRPFYRLAIPRTKSEKQIVVGMCVPISCSMNFLYHLLHESKFIDFKETPIALLETSCQVAGEPSEFKTIDYIVALILMAFVAMGVVSTAYDLYHKNDPSASPLLKSFSLYTNAQKTLSCRNSNSPDVMNCLNGIRAMSTMWVVLGHSFIMHYHFPMTNRAGLAKFSSRFINTYVFDSIISVDSFLFVGGLVASYNMLIKLSKSNGKINIPMLYLNRYIRLTPIFAISILATDTLFRFLGGGPLWVSLMDSQLVSLKKWWWSVLLYTQNYTNPTDMAWTHSWYLCVDMQLFIISPFIIVAIHRYGTKAIGACIAAIAAISVITVIQYVKYNFGYMLFTPVQFEASYTKTQYRFVPWLMGVLTGYYLFKIRGQEIHLSKKINIAAWTITLITLGGLILVSYPLMQVGSKCSSLQFGLFDTIGRILWSLGLAYIVFACHHGYGGDINSFLSHPVFQPLNRLGYSMFLLHYPIIVYIVFTRSYVPFFTKAEFYRTAVTSWVASIFVCIIASSLFESPVMFLWNLMMTPKRGLAIKHISSEKEVKAE